MTGVRELAATLARWDRNHRRELVEKRRKLGLSQADLAKILGVRVGWVRRMERYDSDPRLSELRRYECALHADHHSSEPSPDNNRGDN